MTEFPYERNDDTVRIELPDELIVRNRTELRVLLAGLLEEGVRVVALDFTRTERIDSAALGVLVSISKKVRDVGGELRLLGVGESIWDLFRATKLDTVFARGTPGDDAGAGRSAPVVPRSPRPARESAWPEPPWLNEPPDWA